MWPCSLQWAKPGPCCCSQFHTGSAVHFFFYQAVRQVQSMLLVSVNELKPAEAACATLGPTGLGCYSDPAAFCNSVSNWYKAQASTASNPKPPRLNLAAKDNSQGTRAAVGRSPSLPRRCTSPYSVNVIPQQITENQDERAWDKSSWSMSLRKTSDNPYTEQASGIRCSMPERWTPKVSVAYSWHLSLAQGWVESSERAPGIQKPPLPQQTSAQSSKTVWFLPYHHSKIWNSRSVKQVEAIMLCC